MTPFPAVRALAFRPRMHAVSPIIGVKRPATHRCYADNSKLPEASQNTDNATGPNMQQEQHVSEETAQMNKIMGQEGPDLDVGTPVQDVRVMDVVAMANY
jgi:small subunit ribosomal protein S7